MVTKEIRKVRCDDALQVLTSLGSAVFFTLTTRDEVSLHEIRERWRVFRHDFFQCLSRSTGRRPQYVMNYELHPGYLIKVVRDSRTVERVLHGTGRSHGWHIHGVVDSFLPASVMLFFASRSGFGRIDFRRVNSTGVSDYLTKHALKAYRGLTKRERDQYKGMRIRLVNSSRGLPSLDSYAYNSAEIVSRRVVKRDILFELYGTDKVDGIDHRVIASHADVCMRLGFQYDWQLLHFIERLQFLRKIEILQNCKNSQKCENRTLQNTQ